MGVGGRLVQRKGLGDFGAEGARRAASGEKGGQGVRWEGARTALGLGPWAGGERSEAWAGGEGKAGVNLPVKASPEAPAWTNGPRALVPSGAAAAPPVS